MQTSQLRSFGISLLTLLLFCCSGCGEHKAAQSEFREKLAAMKIAAEKGVNRTEFRQLRLAIQTHHEANKRHLTKVEGSYVGLSQVMDACEYCWDRGARTLNPDPKTWPELYAAMLIISPSVKAKLEARTPYEERKKDPDFVALNYVRRALSQIAGECETMMDSL